MSEVIKKLDGINTESATPMAESWGNVRANYARMLPKFEQLPDFNQKKPASEAIAIVGGGPSLRRTCGELKSFPRIIAAGTVHDWLIERGIVPEFAACCDPDPISQAYFQNPCHDVTYLLATQCNPALFDHLAGYRVVKWHCHPIDMEFLNEHEVGWHAVSGGCTVGLRCISMAIMLGYSNIHFFGFDSCLDGDSHHAYEYATDREQLGRIFEVRAGTDVMSPDEVAAKLVYRAEGYMLAQAYHFKLFFQAYNHLFTPTFHGGGLLPDWWDGVKNLITELEQAA